jgi:hypothetical protein
VGPLVLTERSVQSAQEADEPWKQSHISIKITETEKRRVDELLADPFTVYLVEATVTQGFPGLAAGKYSVWRRYRCV